MPDRIHAKQAANLPLVPNDKTGKAKAPEPPATAPAAFSGERIDR